MPDATNRALALDHARLAGNNWRTGRDNMRKLARYLVTAAMIDNFAVDPLIGEAKKALNYAKQDKQDQGSIRVFFTACRSICEAWPALKQEQRDAFTTGALVYSTLLSDVKKREKLDEDTAAKAAEVERLAELGIDAETDEANKAREVDELANIAAVERVLTLMARDHTLNTQSEGDAISRIIDAVNALQSMVVDQAQAA